MRPEIPWRRKRFTSVSVVIAAMTVGAAADLRRGPHRLIVSGDLGAAAWESEQLLNGRCDLCLCAEPWRCIT